MCGRFAFFSPAEAVTRLFGVGFPLELESRYNIAPTQYVAALRGSTGGAGDVEPAMLRWGLVPSWARDSAVGNRMINARAETVREKPSFRAAFKRRRCIVLADGYYEWQRRPDGKHPFFITRRDGEPFAMAGLWESWRGDGDSPLETCAIITTAAAGAMAELHHRMPVVLSPGESRRWMTLPEADGGELESILKSTAVDAMQFHSVSKRVNNPGNEGPDLIEEG